MRPRIRDANGLVRIRRQEDKPVGEVGARKNKRALAEYEICSKCTKPDCKGSELCMKRKKKNVHE